MSIENIDVDVLAVHALRILVIVLGAVVVSRFGARAAERLVQSVSAHADTRRAAQRSETLAQVLGSLVRVAVWAAAILSILDELGYDLAPLLAGAGIAGIAIAFGTQSLVKDFVTGFFMLLEDQYGVGDTVKVGETTGTVEDLTLRVTRMRSLDGTVWFVPNGEIRKLGNASLDWARSIVDVVVPASVDATYLAAVLTDEVRMLAQDPGWAADVIEPPEVWGAHALGREDLTLRVAAKATAGREEVVARELRLRLQARLRREGILGAAVTAPPAAAAGATGPAPAAPAEESPADRGPTDTVAPRARPEPAP